MTHAQRVKIVVPITNLLLVVELAKNVWVDFANKKNHKFYAYFFCLLFKIEHKVGSQSKSTTTHEYWHNLKVHIGLGTKYIIVLWSTDKLNTHND